MRDERQYAESVRLLRTTSEALLKKYIELVESGDAGFWDPLNDDEVMDLSFAIQQYDLLAARIDGSLCGDA